MDPKTQAVNQEATPNNCVPLTKAEEVITESKESTDSKLNSSDHLPTPHGEESSMNVPDWKNELQPQLRELLVGKMSETLEWYCPFSDPASLDVLKKMAIRFEEKIFTSATIGLFAQNKFEDTRIGFTEGKWFCAIHDVDDCSSSTSSLESANSPAGSA
ncbi:hypothetical protein Q3G72_026011 [Acer saccharum]|nr:hypothetical protein Q3G72_026011 [Acer saccharum]